MTTYIAITAVVIYLLRFLPLLLIKGKIKSRFLNSLFAYMPYAVLSALIFPAVFYCTDSVLTATVGAATALILAVAGVPFFAISLLSCLAVYAASLI